MLMCKSLEGICNHNLDFTDVYNNLWQWVIFRQFQPLHIMKLYRSSLFMYFKLSNLSISN